MMVDGGRDGGKVWGVGTEEETWRGIDWDLL